MAEVTGTVSLRLLGLPNCKALVRIVSGEKHRLSAVGPPWSQELSLEGVLCEAAAAKVTVELVDPKTKQVLGSVEMHLGKSLERAGQWSASRVLDFAQARMLLVRVKWEPLDRESYLLLKYVRKIQAVWRGRHARKQLEVLRHQRKLLGRRGLEANGSLYLVSCYDSSPGLELQLHGASAAPTRPLLHTLSLTGSDAAAALAAVTVSEAQQLVA